MPERLDYTLVAPAGAKALGGVYGYIVQSGLDLTLVELIYLRVSQINGCAYCIDMHTRDLVKKGISHEKLALLPVWQEVDTLFTPRERAALAWAETVTRVAETTVPEADFLDAHSEFTDKELVDLTIAVGLMNAYNRIAISFRKPPEAVSGNRALGERS